MKRFRFPLRPVAVLRAHQELRAREAFGAAVHAYVAAEEQHAAAKARSAAFERELFSGRRERFSAAVEAEGGGVEGVQHGLKPLGAFGMADTGAVGQHVGVGEEGDAHRAHSSE